MDTSAFFDLLFGFKREDHWILVWTAPGNHSTWFADPAKAAEYATKVENKNVYVQVSLSDHERGATERCKSEEVAAMAAFGCDVDYRSAAHDRSTYPTQEKALAFFDKLPLKPTLVVHTGNGYQGWWVFKEPWETPDFESRQRASNVSKGWHETLKTIARRDGWALDAVHDLARVLRVPGTKNCKGKIPLPVTVIVEGGPLYGGLGDFESYVSSPGEEGEEKWEINFSLDAGAIPNPERWANLCAAEPLAEATYKRRRKDLHDSSPSGYDWHLARYAIMARWSDQEIVNLLIASRRERGEDLKLNRPDYYARTIAKARKSQKRYVALDSLSTTEAGDVDAKRIVSDILGVEIEDILRYSGDRGLYYLVVRGQRLPLGGVENLVEQRGFLLALADAGIVLDGIPKLLWLELRVLLRKMAREVDLGP